MEHKNDDPYNGPGDILGCICLFGPCSRGCYIDYGSSRGDEEDEENRRRTDPPDVSWQNPSPPPNFQPMEQQAYYSIKKRMSDLPSSSRKIYHCVACTDGSVYLWLSPTTLNAHDKKNHKDDDDDDNESRFAAATKRPKI